MPRTVYCEYEKRETEGLDFVPYPGELGKRVFAHIGKSAWAAWLAHQTMLINENRLSRGIRSTAPSWKRNWRNSCSAVAPTNPPATSRRREKGGEIPAFSVTSAAGLVA